MNDNNQFNNLFNGNQNNQDQQRNTEVDNSKKNNTVLLSVIGVATLLVALVGATFAYFSATVTNNSQQSVSIATASVANLEYKQTKAITLVNAKPGDKTDGTTGKEPGGFTITNPDGNTMTLYYDLDLIVDTNTFTAATSPAQLYLTITGATSDTTNGTAPTITTFNGDGTDVTDGTEAFKTGTTTKFVTQQAIVPGETQTYTSNLDFKELGKPQDENQSKSFVAHIDVTNIKSNNK